MSGVEALAVIAAVAAIVSAYKDGGSIVRKLQDRRARKHDQRLEEALIQSLDCGRDTIEEAKAEGTARHGRRFEIGDDRATSELWKITAELNGLLLKHLQHALTTDTFEDFSSCKNVSDEGRYKSLSVLGELSMRLEEARMLMSLPPPSQPGPSSPPRSESTKANGKQRRASSNQPQPISYFPQFQWRGMKMRKSSKPDNLQPKSNTFHGSSNRSSLSNSSSPSMSSSPGEQRVSRYEPGVFTGWQLTSGTSDVASVRSSLSKHASSPEQPQSPVDELLANHWSTEGGQSSMPDSTTITRTTTGDSQSRMMPSTSVLMPRPNADNGYLGLCRGAVAFQSMDLLECFTSNREMAFGRVEYLMCKYCAFTGKIDRAQVYSSDGVRLRWAFLAKSHIREERVQKNMHSYRCLFCIFSANPAPVIKGINELFKHLATHQNISFGDSLLHNAILQQTRCISGETADDTQDFDVNLCPVEPEPIRLRTVSLPQTSPQFYSETLWNDGVFR